jgi:arylsulfatase
VLAIRAFHWNVHFMEQRAKGLGVWQEPFSPLRVPKLFNLRADPFEVGDGGIFYDKWVADHVFVQVPIQSIAAQWLSSFREFPLRSKPASFHLDRVVEEFMPHPEPSSLERQVKDTRSAKDPASRCVMPGPT